MTSSQYFFSLPGLASSCLVIRFFFSERCSGGSLEFPDNWKSLVLSPFSPCISWNTVGANRIKLRKLVRGQMISTEKQYHKWKKSLIGRGLGEKELYLSVDYSSPVTWHSFGTKQRRNSGNAWRFLWSLYFFAAIFVVAATFTISTTPPLYHRIDSSAPFGISVIIVLSSLSLHTYIYC